MGTLAVIIMGVLAGTLVVYLFACIFFRKRKIREKETNHSTAKRDVSPASQQLDFTNAAGSDGKDGGMVVLGGADAVAAAAVVASTYGAGDDGHLGGGGCGGGGCGGGGGGCGGS
ncbi:hypothetical protein ACJW30_11G045200 [Castanea mollissima]